MRRMGSASKQGIRRQSFRAMQLERLEQRELFAVTYHGGALLNHVEAQAVYLGTDWSTNSNLQNQASQLDQYLNYLVQSPYMDMLTNAEYGVGRGSSSTGVTLNTNINKQRETTDAQIQSNLQSAISSGQLQQPDANRLYIVYVEPGVAVNLDGSSSRNQFLGYHGAFAGRDVNGKSVDIRYAVMPYPGSPNPPFNSSGFATSTDQLTSVSSHEIAEAVTDPDVNYKQIGWYDDRLGGEIGDLTVRETRLNGFLVQDVVDKSDRVIAPQTSDTGSNNGGTGTGGTTTITATQHVAATAVSSTKAHLTWDVVSGAEGYRIFLVTGGSLKLLGSVSASHTSVDIVGLTPATTVTFVIQTVQGSNTADSSPTSVTLPASSAAFKAPDVTASPVSSNKLKLDWNAVDGAIGYRIYRVVGTRMVYVGAVDAKTTSVNIWSNRGNRVSKWIVQAYSNNQVANSNAVSVTLPRRTSNFQHW